MVVRLNMVIFKVSQKSENTLNRDCTFIDDKSIACLNDALPLKSLTKNFNKNFFLSI